MNIQDARDLLMQHGTACFTNGFPVAYPDVPFDPTDKAQWARVSAKHAGRAQRGFKDANKKYVAFGVLCVEIYAQQGDGMQSADTLANAAVLYLENITSSPIWYRNIRAIEGGQDGAFTKINVYAEFEYQDNH